MKKHTCIFNRECWCGAGQTQVLHNRVRVGGVGGKSGYPYYSDALGVHPEQAAEECAAYKKAGVPTELNEKGQVKIESRAHLQQVLKLNKMHERSSCRLGGHVCA